MAERSSEGVRTMDPALVEPLIAALDDADDQIRVGTLWALLALPMTETNFLSIGGYARTTLVDYSARTSDELRSVIGAVPWIPLSSVRQLVARFANGEFEVDTTVRWAAERAIERISKPGIDEPAGSPITPAGFSEYSTVEREQLSNELSQFTEDELWMELRNDDRESTRSERRTAFIVTLLMERAGRACSLRSGHEVARWAEDRETTFKPDLEGLFNELVRLRPLFPRLEPFIARQIAWLVSRGGLLELVAALQVQLKSRDRQERLAALALIQYSAAYMRQRTSPLDWISVAVESEYQEPAIAIRLEVLDESFGADHGLDVDDDVQFTLYRPSRVTPEVWHPLVAFAHRTAPLTLAGGGVVQPVKEVEQRAARLLSGLPSTYETVRGDSEAGLPHGTDLLFEPWIETGEFNPRSQSLRWEEAVHEVHFRLRVPQSADGSRLRGGIRVFAGAVLIGDLTFRMPVSSAEPVVPITTERDTTRGFRQIFASYSHRDVAVVDAVERFVSLTGDRYLIDARTLRSGEEWSKRLCELIDEADIFQLFWSRNAMESEFVRQEWEYALELGREGFVRPVYWEEPFAEDPDRDLPPERLRQLHFSQLGVDPLRITNADRSATAADPVPHIATPTPPTTVRERVVCAICGSVNHADERFCRRCRSFLGQSGRKVDPPADPPALAPPSGALRPDARNRLSVGETTVDGRVTSVPTGEPTAVTPMRPTAPAQRQKAAKQSPSRRTVPGALICDGCGEGNPPARNYCRRCGTTLNDAAVAEQGPWRIPSRRRRALEAGARPRRDKTVDIRSARTHNLLRAAVAAIVVATAVLVVVLSI